MSTAVIGNHRPVEIGKQKIAALTERLPAHPDAEKVRSAIEAAIGTAGDFGRRRADLQRSGKYTHSGLKDQLAADVRNGFAARLNHPARVVKALRRKLDELKATIKPRDIDKSDIVSEMRRAEMRSFLFDLNDFGERMVPAAKRVAAACFSLP